MRLLLHILPIVLILGKCSCNRGRENGPEGGNGGKNKVMVNGKPEMTFESDFYDFGTVIEGEKVAYSFVFKNTGNSDLLILEAIPDCGCTALNWDKKPLRPGETGEVEVVFDSKGKHGSQYKTVALITNAGKRKKLLTIKANVIDN